MAGQEVAGGHAFEKHVLQQGEFGGLEIRTRDQFENHIESVINNPTTTKQLSGGRSAGGASEFVIPNGQIPAGAVQRIVP